MNIPLIKYWLSTSRFGTRWVDVVAGESGGVSKSENVPNHWKWYLYNPYQL